MPPPAAALDDKYTRTAGTIYLNGLQALVRLLLLQRQRDKAAGLNTAGFVSGYRGSPLGGFDRQLLGAARFLDAHQVRFQPGLNEDLAATAIWGSQQVNLFPGALYDGVFGLWYGKGPGVDRSGDVFRHANAAGTSRHGGVLAIAGDDHAARSSTLPHQTEHAFISAMIPVLHPAGVQDLLDFGLLGWAMSRFSGCWVAIKTTAELLDSAATVSADPERVRIAVPADFTAPPGGLAIRWPDDRHEQERRLQLHKLYAALAFAAANHLDRIVLDSPRARLGIITTGKSYLDVRQALDDLGIDDDRAAELGIRLYKVGMPWPLEEDGARSFARGLEEILVVEEKRAIIENQLEAQLFNAEATTRPRIVGKFSESGEWLLPAAGELDAAMIARVIAGRLRRLHPGVAFDAASALPGTGAVAPLTSEVQRLPYFCAGCPHNTSTRVPDGSRALAGIGCHYMALWMDRSTATSPQMGGEGATWIGLAPFTSESHVFQNLGDGTYFHSGSLAIRAAQAAGVNITYKLLFNHAVAMTGGQPVDGEISVPRLISQLQAEGVRRIAVVTADPAVPRPGGQLAAGVSFHDRDELDSLQRELRTVAGVSVLIYDQMCATEQRRRRKRGLAPAPAARVYINEWVCEGCGDCSAVSNCLAVVPLDTEFGRKRTIDQDSCNQDLACLGGFCPSFVTVQGAPRRRRELVRADLAGVPEPRISPPDSAFSIVVAGVGGTGVVTLSAVLGMAAHLDGLQATTLDQTGLAQKFGAVLSHVRIAARPGVIHAPRIPAGHGQLLLAADMLVAAGAEALGKMAAEDAWAVVNADADPPPAIIRDRDFEVPEASLRMAIEDAVPAGSAFCFPAGRLARALTGDRVAANFMLLGFAWQRGLIPVRGQAILAAIALNGVAVEQNREAFNWGRIAAHDLEVVIERAGDAALPPRGESLKGLVARRSAWLEAYQDEEYAARYEALVRVVEAAEQARCGGTERPLAETVARAYFRLLAYKDEYEVARLFAGTGFLARVRADFDGGARLRFHLSPPLLAGRDPTTGRPKKIEFGAWIVPFFHVLARLRFLRGTPLDPFGYSRDRRTERRLIVEYEQLLGEILPRLGRNTRGLVVELADLPNGVRGYGPVKMAAVATARRRQDELLERLRAVPQ